MVDKLLLSLSLCLSFSVGLKDFCRSFAVSFGGKADEEQKFRIGGGSFQRSATGLQWLNIHVYPNLATGKVEIMFHTQFTSKKPGRVGVELE